MKNTNIDKVYFDMDGVLVDFDRSLQIFSKMSVEDMLKSREGFKKGGLEQDPILVLMHKYVKEGLFEEAPEMPEFNIFLEMMEWLDAQGIDYEILSSVTGEDFGDFAIEQKKNWLKKKKVECIQNYTRGAAEKIQFTGSPNVVLIDDYKKNIETFLSNNSQAIHHKNIKNTLDNFREYFPEFKVEKNIDLLHALSNKSILDEDTLVKHNNKENTKKRRIAF